MLLILLKLNPQMVLNLIIVSIVVFVLNIPFGYWRANVKKFSLQWVLSIHVPIPFIIALRIIESIGFAWYTYIFLVGAFFLGQQLGAHLQKVMKQNCNKATSCLIMDLVRCNKSK